MVVVTTLVFLAWLGTYFVNLLVLGQLPEEVRTLAGAGTMAGMLIPAVMATPPMLTRLSPTDQTNYYRAIADAVAVPVIVQDASGYVGQAIATSVYVALLEKYGEEKILFKPEASPIGPKYWRWPSVLPSCSARQSAWRTESST
jgi:hypothetical protein